MTVRGDIVNYYYLKPISEAAK